MDIYTSTIAPVYRAKAIKINPTPQARPKTEAPRVIENDRYIPRTPATSGKWWEPGTSRPSTGATDNAAVSDQATRVKAAADKVAQSQQVLEADQKAIAEAQAAVEKSKGGNKEENARLEAALKTAKGHNAQLQKDLEALKTEVAGLEAVNLKVQDPTVKAKVEETVKALNESVGLGLETSKQADRTLDAGLKVTEALKSSFGGQIKAYQEAKKAEEEGKKLAELYARQQATQQTSRTAFEGLMADLNNRVKVAK